MNPLEQQSGTGELDKKFAEQNQALAQLIEKLVAPLNALMIGVIIVLFVGFITLLFQVIGMLIESNTTKATSAQDLQDEVQAQNAKIDALTHELELERTQNSKE